MAAKMIFLWIAGNEARHFKVVENTGTIPYSSSPAAVTYNYKTVPGIDMNFVGKFKITDNGGEHVFLIYQEPFIAIGL